MLQYCSEISKPLNALSTHCQRVDNAFDGSLISERYCRWPRISPHMHVYCLLGKSHQESNNKQELCHEADDLKTDSLNIELSATNNIKNELIYKI